MSDIKFLNHYGDIASSAETGAVCSNFTLNTPVGIASDQNGHIWVCDTGNNQIVIFDKDLKCIIDVIKETPESNKKSKKIRLFLPFHLTPHPEEKKMYLTDMGNQRVVVFSYDNEGADGYAAYTSSFGQKEDGINILSASKSGDPDKFTSLTDPNGITLVKENGQFVIYVTDEFFHTAHDMRNRCVKFDINGKFISQFKAVTDEYGKCYPLKWPQGLTSDSEGSLYLANTGYYEVLKICSGALDDYAAIVKKYSNPHKDNTKLLKENPKDEHLITNKLLKLKPEYGSPFVHSFGNPKGSGYTNIIRGVNIINGLAFIPDQVANKISVYDTKLNQLVCMIESMTPTLSVVSHSQKHVGSPSDWIYNFAENTTFISPYGICAGSEKDTYFITEPTVSCVLKVKMTIPQSTATCGYSSKTITPQLLAKIGSRRTKTTNDFSSCNKKDSDNDKKNIPDDCEKDSQFNVVTAVAGIKQDLISQTTSSVPALPDNLQGSPFLPLWNSLNMSYRLTYGHWLKPYCKEKSKTISGTLYNIGAGNWTIKAYKACADQPNKFVQRPKSIFSEYFIPLGNVGMAVYYPQTAMLGQICPGTPLVFITNFISGFVSMCQFDLKGQLVYYGLPFGFKGECEFSLNGPQGITISTKGEIYIANSMSHCISKWQILPTGYVKFVKTFGGDVIRNFMPTDVTIDKDNRIFVCDQLNNKIYVFDAEGNLLKKHGQTGYWKSTDAGAAKNAKHFQLPTSVCVDGDKLVVNDLVNRAIKIFTIKDDDLEYYAGQSLFEVRKGEGGTWMPYLMHAENGKIYVPDCAYNLVNVYEYD